MSERELEVTIYLYDDTKEMREVDFIPFIARFAARVPEFADHKVLPSDSPTERTRERIFISYSHQDRVWEERLEKMLKPLVRNNIIHVWADRQIKPGSRWREEIQQALSMTKVAVLLVSPEFLASDFIANEELPPLFSGAAAEGVTIMWACISSCLYEETPIESYQAAHDISKPLDTLTEAERNNVLANICREIKKAYAQN